MRTPDKLSPPMVTTAKAAAPDRRRPEDGTPSKIDRVVGHPLAFMATVLILLALFGSTFVIHPGRTAPTRDPAFYTWRTEALLTEEPSALIEIEGPNGLFSGGYRISAPVLGGLLRRIADVDSRSTVAFLMVVSPIIISLALAGFAYSRRRDPLLWHTVAYASAGLMLTPPFVGYLDNVLSMLFLAGALWFIAPARNSWKGRAGFGLFLLATGVTHTTTLAIFGLTLGAMSAIRVLMGRFEDAEPGLIGRTRAVVKRDGPMLATALVAAIATIAIWTLGIWGPPAPLSESALVFPYSKSFFSARLDEWISAMRPLLNGPLLILGVVGLLAAGRRWVRDDLALTAVVWLAPLVGTFGFLLGLSYPYYRFFNTTLAWVLLVGVGAYFALRFFINRARDGGIARLYIVGAAAVILILVTNYTEGFEATHWNDPIRGWLTAAKRADLDLLRANLEVLDQRDRPVVFVMDVRPPEIETLAQVWGITQVNGNTARYGLPAGQIDRGYMYQGSLQNYLAGEPTLTGDSAYDDLARASYEEVNEGVADSDQEPLVVVASVFNENGPNAAIPSGEEPIASIGTEADVWLLDDERITAVGDTSPPIERTAEEDGASGAGAGHIVWLLIACALLLLPGVLLARWLLPHERVIDRVAIAPAISVASLVLIGTAALAIVRGPLSTELAWTVLAVAIAVSAVLSLKSPAGMNRRAGIER